MLARHRRLEAPARGEDMRTLRMLLSILLGWLWTTSDSHAASSHTAARLVLSADSARPGDTVWAGVHLTMDPGWHTYWRNPGESGLATTIEWVLPPSVRAGDIRWPPPEAHAAAGMTTFVYHDETTLLVPLTLASNAPPGRIDIQAQVAWLECQDACLPGDASLSASFNVGPELKPSTASAQIETWRRRIPLPNPTLETRVAWTRAPGDESAELVIEGAGADRFRPTDFYPYESERYVIEPAVTALEAEPGRFRLAKTLKRLDQEFPARVAGLLIQPGAAPDSLMAAEVTLDLAPATLETSPANGPSLSPPPVTSAPAGATLGLLLKMLGLGFLGGLILNIMPCVLPVIALKILGFVQQSKEAPRRVRLLGLLYAAGVLASFLALAGFVIAVRHAGEAASWGMQMQNPFFRLALTVVVTLVALNLFGVFEVTLGGGAMGAAAGLATKEGNLGAFFNGVLATALATPCTAPFLTVALGFAFTQPASVIVLMFIATAIGLATPYVLLSWKPGWLRFVPKPGRWMERFKVAMGFPMLATAVWLFDLTVPAYGDGGVLWVGLFLVSLALAAWVWGEFVQRGQSRKGLAVAVVLLLLGGGYAVGLESQLQWRRPPAASTNPDVVWDSPDGLAWHRWTPEAVADARTSGKLVLVDFTAKWCLTCKANKRLAIDIPSVRAKLEESDGIAFRADYTNKDPRIAAELKRYERAGVPLVLVFPRRSSEPAIVLPAALTPGLVLDALDQAALEKP